MLIFDKVDFKSKLTRRDNRGHVILVKVTIHKKLAQSYTHQHKPWHTQFHERLTGLKSHNISNLVIVDDFNALFS